VMRLNVDLASRRRRLIAFSILIAVALLISCYWTLKRLFPAEPTQVERDKSRLAAFDRRVREGQTILDQIVNYKETNGLWPYSIRDLPPQWRARYLGRYAWEEAKQVQRVGDAISYRGSSGLGPWEYDWLLGRGFRLSLFMGRGNGCAGELLGIVVFHERSSKLKTIGYH